MPLIKSASKKAVSKNISEMVKSGHPQKQAVAATLENQRRMKSRSGMYDRWKAVRDRMAGE